MNRHYCNGMVHVIKQGETLYQLSRKYRVPLAMILRANPYVDVYNLQVGQEICIPVVRPYNGMICMPAPPMPRDEEVEKGGEQMDLAGYREETCPVCEQEEEEELEKQDQDDEDDVEIYVTTGGRSLGGILEEYGVDWEEFVRKNNLNQIVLSDDVVLYLPKKTNR